MIKHQPEMFILEHPKPGAFAQCRAVAGALPGPTERGDVVGGAEPEVGVACFGKPNQDPWCQNLYLQKASPKAREGRILGTQSSSVIAKRDESNGLLHLKWPTRYMLVL